MGVLGLWSILESVGHPIKLEALEGKRLGVDANLWLYKFIRGFRDKDNATDINSHKLGLFNRICKLLFYKIKPIFVFDGPAPTLKRRTLERRQNIRIKHLEKQRTTAVKLFKEQLQRQYPDLNLDSVDVSLPNLKSDSLAAAEKLTDEDRELFYLPPQVVTADESHSDDDDYIPPDYVINHIQALNESMSSGKSDSMIPLRTKNDTIYLIDSDDDLLDTKPEIKGESQIKIDHTNVDIESKDFEQLPPEIRYTILKDVKETRRRVHGYDDLPEDSESFSNFQLERLKRRRRVQEKIEKCEKDICSMYTGELNNQVVEHFRVQSDARANMLLIKNKDVKLSKEQLQREYSDSDLNSVDNSLPNLKSDSLAVAENLTVNDREPIQPPPQVVTADESHSDDEDYMINQIQAIDKSLSPGKSDSVSVIDETAPTLKRRTVESRQNNSTKHLEKQQTTAVELSKEKVQGQCSDLNLDSVDVSLPNLKSDSLAAAEKHTGEDREPVQPPPQVMTADESHSDDDDYIPPDYVINHIQALNESMSSGKSDSIIPPRTKNDTIYLIDSDDDLLETKPETEQAKPVKPVNIDLANDEINSQSEKLQVDQESEKEDKGKDKDIGSVYTSELINQVRDPKSERQANKVTNKIIEDAKELLRLFGIPFIDAAGEAEAQCATLESLKLTEGTITDDSDIWLFGSQNVYRYFFSDDKYVMQYKMMDIEHHIRMTRENLVCFAMLVGSDYTDGIMNVGPVTALEILSEFPGQEIEPLIKFTNWKTKYNQSKGEKIPGSKKRERFLKFHIPDEFPSRVVFDGYMKPMADRSEDEFVWGVPDLDALREYARRNFDWDIRKIDDKLLPVMKKVSEKKKQTTIDSFFFKTAANQNPELFRSKRVNQALSKIATKKNQRLQ